MRDVFAHEARLELPPDGDHGAVGAAVTVALCGAWEHQGPCRWPHHTSVGSDEAGALVVRTVFVSDIAEEPTIRDAIASAYHLGSLDGPNGVSRWTVLREGPSSPDGEEQAIGARWVDG